MPLRVKVDEDLSEEVAAVFAAAGYVSDTVRTQAWVDFLLYRFRLKARCAEAYGGAI
jgi:hypothetical protein